MSNKPLIVFAFSTEGPANSTRYGGFAKRLQKSGLFEDYELLTIALDNLVFIVREDKSADVIDLVSGISLSKADLVYFKSRAQSLGEADALAHFLKSRGIPFMDTRVLSIGDSKISTIFKLWSANINLPLTVYSRNKQHMVNYITENKIYGDQPFVIKDIYGAKGQNNLLVTNTELASTLKKHSDVIFMAQRYVKNDGDYRVGVYASKVGFVIHRKGDGKSHLNNTSTGGKATYIKTQDAPIRLKNMARRAAAAMELEVAGVDLIVDKDFDKAYVLEVNRGSQIVTGAYVDENVEAFSKAMILQAKKRHSKSRMQPMSMVGRRARIKLPELGVVDAVAKIDSGAYTSTLHAHEIKVEGDELTFKLQPGDGYVTNTNKTKTIRTKDFFTQKVRSSNGHIQTRYSIRTKLAVGGKVVKATLTLSDRSTMGYPLLIGRRVIRSRFLVNVELNEENNKVWEF